jgi:hypothetical protein
LFNHVRPEEKELTLKRTSKTKAGVRSGYFSLTLLFLTEVLNLQMVFQNKEKEFAQLILPSGEILELRGQKNIWHPFTTPPDWEIVIANVRHAQAKE